jgi:hypothetical protein
LKRDSKQEAKATKIVTNFGQLGQPQSDQAGRPQMKANTCEFFLPAGHVFYPFWLPCPVECGAYSSGVSRKDKEIKHSACGGVLSGRLVGSKPEAKTEAGGVA